MKAAVVVGAGQPPTYAEFTHPQAGAGEVVVKVAAAALSPHARARASGAHYSAGGGCAEGRHQAAYLEETKALRQR